MKLYIGGLDPSVTNDEVKSLFNGITQPIAVYRNKPGYAYAYVESYGIAKQCIR